MKNFLIVLSLFSSVLFLSGCSTTLYTYTNEEKTYNPTDSKNISVTTNDFCEKKYTELGCVSATETNLLTSKNELKRIAAKMGGDEIINFKVTVVRTFVVIIIIPVPINHYICRGTIIKYV